MWSTDPTTTAAALVQALTARQKAQAQSDLVCWKAIKLPLHHLTFGQATITGTGSYHILADNLTKTQALGFSILYIIPMLIFKFLQIQ